MASVVGVHGIAQEQLGLHQLLNAWQPALLDGLEIAARSAAPPAAPFFNLVYYGDLFTSVADQGARVTKGAGARSCIDGLEDLSPDEVAFLEDAVNDIPIEATRPAKGFVAVPDVLLPLTRRLCRRFDGRLALMLVVALRQVRLYLQDDALAEEIRSRVVEKIGSGCDVLVGHSLGSVVAFETLALHPELRVGTLLTVGSPLSMRTIATRLRAGDPSSGLSLPEHERRWANVYDKSDPVAGAGVVSRLWPTAEDFEVNNGNEPHSITRYLSKKAVGAVVLASTSTVS